MRRSVAGITIRPTLVAAVLLMLLWLAGYSRLNTMSTGFFQPSWSGLRGLALYLGGRHAEAARAYRAAQHDAEPADYGRDPSGYLALRAGDLALAERRAATTLVLVPSAIEPRVTLAEIALERRLWGETRSLLKAILKRAPDHPDALYLAAIADARLGEDGAAIDALNRALRAGATGTRDTLLLHILETGGELGARRDRPLCLLAHLYRYVRIFDEAAGDLALAYAREAIVAGDHPADAYLTLGVVHSKRGEHEAAMRALLQATEVDPRHAEAHRWAAIKAANRGDLLLEYRMARGAFEAVPADPYYLAPLERVVLGKLGDPHTMVALMERALAVDAANARAHDSLARAAARLGDEALAATHADRARALRAASAEEARPR